MEKLTRVTLLDNTQRPKAPKIENLSAAQRRQGRRLSLYHNHHRQQLREVESAMVQIDDALLAKINALDMRHNFKVFGNMCGQECQMLSGHHGIEDQAVFPVLHEAGDTGLKKVVERLMAEHLVVHELIEELETFAHETISAPTPENFKKLKNTFTTLNTCVQSHFGYEETELEDALGVINVGI
jgi:iron-sulfur cluster repair protein YtfE (RIC family)